MQFKRKRSEADVMYDRIAAAMETGNHGQARTLLTEYRDVNSEAAERIRLLILREYGISL